MRLSEIAPTSVAIGPHPWTRLIPSKFLVRNLIGSVPPNCAHPIEAPLSRPLSVKTGVCQRIIMASCGMPCAGTSCSHYGNLTGHARILPLNRRMRNPLRGNLILRCTRYAASRYRGRSKSPVKPCILTCAGCHTRYYGCRTFLCNISLTPKNLLTSAIFRSSGVLHAWDGKCTTACFVDRIRPLVYRELAFRRIY